MFFSIIIPCYQSSETIANTLHSVFQQQFTDSFEVIVVDSSSDQTADIVKEQFADVVLITRNQRTLAAKARNIGASCAKGKYLVFLDSDCLMSKNWLTDVKNNLSDQYCGLGGPILNGNPDSAVSCAGYYLEFSEFVATRHAQKVKHMPAGNLCISKALFEVSGGFSEHYCYAQEDRLFSWSLCGLTGKQFLFIPSLSVRHFQRYRFKEYIKHQFLIGEGGAEILKITDLFGHRFIKNRLLMLFILPVLPIKKLCICCYRLLQQQASMFFRLPQILPLMAIGMFAWGLGFAKAAVRGMCAD